MEFPDIHSPNKLFDCIVVGAGIEGLATAYRLAKKGCRTLLLEQVGKKIVTLSLSHQIFPVVKMMCFSLIDIELKK